MTLQCNEVCENRVERLTGFEPATNCLEGRDSTGLSYRRFICFPFCRALYNNPVALTNGQVQFPLQLDLK
jgi:hypothetical protein